MNLAGSTLIVFCGAFLAAALALGAEFFYAQEKARSNGGYPLRYYINLNNALFLLHMIVFLSVTIWHFWGAPTRPQLDELLYLWGAVLCVHASTFLLLDKVLKILWIRQ
jgi:hypothetical protein